jgi:hypothetical protein
MAAVVWDAEEWGKLHFGTCRFRDQRRKQRLVKLAIQMCQRPDGSTPEQAETWADLKATYRLFDTEEVTPEEILRPHRTLVRASCRPGDVKLIVSDTTELSYGQRSAASGLGLTSRGQTRGLVAHTALMVDPHGGHVDGIAAQKLFSRAPQKRRQDGQEPFKNTVRRSPDRESVVWSEVIEDAGPPPEGVKYLHVCDRGADDFEIFQRTINQHCGFVIRAAKLNRGVWTTIEKPPSLIEKPPSLIEKPPSLIEKPQPLSAVLETFPVRGEQVVDVPAQRGKPGRCATVSLRWGAIHMPLPRVLTPWLKERAVVEPLSLNVVEAVEQLPPEGVAPLRWVLYTTEPVTTLAEAQTIIEYYKKRWTIEDFHKAWKTGCQVEGRQYETAARLSRVATVQAVVAVRLLQMRTAAKETPNVAAETMAPKRWVQMLRVVRKLPADKPLTIRDFVRHLAGLGGFLMRKGDGEPGWITLWRGHEKLQLMLRGADASKRCG